MSSSDEPEVHLDRVARSLARQLTRAHKAARRRSALHEREVRRHGSSLQREKRAIEQERRRLRLEERWLREQKFMSRAAQRRRTTAHSSDDGDKSTEQQGVLDDVQAAFREADGDGEVVGTGGYRSPRPPPPARLLSLASLLLAPGERENWLGELRTARWELRADPRARRRETWVYFQALGTSFVTSWRYRGDGPTQEVS